MISFAQAIERRVENIRITEKEKRPDLYVIATGYSGQLKIRKSSFVREDEFHIKENKNKQHAPQATVKAEANAVVKKENEEPLKSNGSMVTAFPPFFLMTMSSPNTVLL